MAPVHDTDVAQNRWEEAQWRNFELWEKLEQKEARKKKIWVVSTILLFLCLSAVPVILDRTPKWESRKSARELADHLVELKALAATTHYSYRFRIIDADSLEFQIEKLLSCRQGSGTVVRKGKLAASSSRVALVDQSRAALLNLNDSISDFSQGSFSHSNVGNRRAFVFIPAKDLTERRDDRISVVSISGQDARITFN